MAAADPTGTATQQIAFSDPRWFPVDLQVDGRRYGFLHLDDATLERESFLDARMQIDWTTAMPVDASAIPALPQAQEPAWLLHTSFCASTLLARALHLPPWQTCLREPMTLRRLGDACHDDVALDDLPEQAIQLLARPWHPGGHIVIKPTHAALNLAERMMDATPGRRAILLTSSLDDFLVSNLKKTAETQSKIPALIERALKAGEFSKRLPGTGLQPPDLLCAAGLQWAAQRELVCQLADRFADRLRVLDMATLLDDVEAVVLRCAGWLQLPAPEFQLTMHARAVATRNAKATDTAYGPQRRKDEAAFVGHHYRDMLATARSWLDQHVMPAMRADAVAPPTRWELP